MKKEEINWRDNAIAGIIVAFVTMLFAALLANISQVFEPAKWAALTLIAIAGLSMFWTCIAMSVLIYRQE